MNEIADLPINAFTQAPWKKRPATLEGGGGKSPTAPPVEPPPQAQKAPNASVFKERAQSAGQGGMSSGYQSTLMTGINGVQTDRLFSPSLISAASSAGTASLGS